MAQSASAQSWTLPRDADGWSILSPSSDSRLIYVSASEGDDATARAYSTADVGGDPRHPTIDVAPYKTIQAAMGQMRDTYPDWVLLKAGDTFPSQAIRLHQIGIGRNSSERMVMTYYGDSPKRPVILSPTLQVFATGKLLAHGGLHHWAIVGIEFYDSKADPDSPDYSSSVTNSGATTILAGGENLLIEDCKFHFYELVIQGDSPTDRWINLELRRNMFLNAYYKNSCSSRDSRPSGAFIHLVTNYLIEENLVDYAGWNPDVAGAGRNLANHGFYLQYSCGGELHFRGNIIARASANGVQNRSGGLVEKNLLIQCPAGLFVAHDTEGEHGPGADPGMTAVRHNVILEGLGMGNCAESSNANFGMPLHPTLESGTEIKENIVAHNLDGLGTVVGIEVQPQVAYLDNIVYDWSSSQDMSDPGWSDPERDIGEYNGSIGGTATTDAFIEECRNRAVGEWPEEYSAYAVIDYIREGFDLDPVGDVAVTGVSIALGSLNLFAGEERILKAEVSPIDASDASVEWSTSDSAIVTISATGVATALAEGVATIRATTHDGGYFDEISVSVQALPETFAEAIDADLVNASTNSYNSAFFGTFREDPAWGGWTLHEGLGWIYTGPVVSSSHFWFWSLDLQSWVYTSDADFPWLWAQPISLWTTQRVYGWIYYFLPSPPERVWYYNSIRSEWKAVSLP